MTQRVLILGPGQSGSYLADVALEHGCDVHVMHRHSSSDNLWRVAHARDRLTLHEGDVLDTASVADVIAGVRPDTVFHTADQDNVGYSHATPGYTADVTASAVVKMLEAVRKIDKGIRWYQPCSATMFGDQPGPQNERTAFNPLSPYAVAKTAAYYACRFYRQVHGMHVSTAILYSHDSPRRAPDYLLQRVARGAVELARGLRADCPLDDTGGMVDVGCAREFAEGVWRMMALPEPGDYVLGTGRGVWVEHLVREAMLAAGVTRKVELPGPKAPVRNSLVADCRRAREAFGWEPKRDALAVVRGLVSHYLGVARA